MGSFVTANTRYEIEVRPDGLLEVTRHPLGDDPARRFGDITEDVAEGFIAVAAVAYNPHRLSDAEGCSDRRRVRFYLADGGRLDTGWADEAALTAAEPAGLDRLRELDKATAAIRRVA